VNAQAGHTILISPIGAFGADLLAAVAAAIGRVFGARTAVAPLVEDLSFAFAEARGQYHSTPILARLAAAAPPEALKVLALAEVDLFIPILTHVFGEAQLGGRSCIVSAFRLGDGLPAYRWRDNLADRLVKESIHELGHTFGLRHCPDPRCTMHYCRSESDVDRKSGELCRYCRVMLADDPSWPQPALRP
jgi:archaemetzincin